MFNLGGWWTIEQFRFLSLKLLQESDCCCSFQCLNVLVLKHLWCFHLTLGFFLLPCKLCEAPFWELAAFLSLSTRPFSSFPSLDWCFLTIPASVRALSFWLVREINSFLVSPFHYYFRCCSCYANSRFFFLNFRAEILENFFIRALLFF